MLVEPQNLSELVAIPIRTVSVRQLVEFVLRQGDLTTGDRTPRKLRARQGSVAHRKLQRGRPEGFENEVVVSYEVITSTFRLRINGRIDGLWHRSEGVLLEEIKTVKPTWNREAELLHWAQLKIYGFIICSQRELSEIELQLTYFELESEQITPFREKFTLEHLREIFTTVVAEYQSWIVEQEAWIHLRNVSIQRLSFPYGQFRKGQRALSAAVYKTLENSGTLFAEAPTGIGKTMSVLFPAVKALNLGKIERLFYLTAKTVTQSLAEIAFSDLRSAGVRLRTVTLTAKEKVCQRDGKTCDLVNCPLTKGYYDRLKPALRQALAAETLIRSTVVSIAEQHRLCPHEFALDISEWVDAVICDYNHAFDPRASLKRHFGDGKEGNVLLIDEAHNLLERAREMFSAELDLGKLSAAAGEMRAAFPRCSSALRRLIKQSELLRNEGSLPIVLTAIPDALLAPLEGFTLAAEQYLTSGASSDDALLEVYYTINAFLQIADYFGPGYRLLVQEKFGAIVIRLFCVDPSELLREVFRRVDASVLFSATLTPLSYFRAALGGSSEDRLLKLASPFPSEHLRVFLASYVQTSFRHRTNTINQLVGAIEAFVGSKTGNYLVYFPSYKYLNEVFPELEHVLTDVELQVQRNDLSDGERVEFLDAFKKDRETSLVGLAVMGGVFGEGIDLVGERLIGAVIVGVGLPQLCLERDLVRQNFDEQGFDGFAYGYVFPGFNRVLQAVGRVIRSESDKGAVLLVDSRFSEERFSELFPAWWNITTCSDNRHLRDELDSFWEKIE